MNFIQANTNGELHDANHPSLSPLNRGFLYGDAVYEVWRSYSRSLFAWHEHWHRLTASAAALGIELGWSPPEILAQIKKTVSAFTAHTGHHGDVYVRLQVYRGAGAIGLDTRLAGDPGYIILVQPVPEILKQAWDQGVSLRVSQTLKRNPVDALNPAWKTGNYLNNLMCLREVKARGADDAVILNHAGHVTEASTSNIAFIRDGYFITPPLDVGILAGITRKIIIDSVASGAGLSVEERRLTIEDLKNMQECMLTSSTKDVQPVGRIDDLPFAVGEGTVSRRLKLAFADYVRNYTSAHPELRV